MANAFLTPTEVTREFLQVLHGKLSFIGNINREYDSRYAVTGAKIGDSVSIKKPPKYTVTDGATLSTQDVVETNVSLTVDTQKHIGVRITDKELTLDLNSFRESVAEPAMAQLAASIEADVLARAKNRVARLVGTLTGSGQLNYRQFRQMGAAMTSALAPSSQRCALLSPDSGVEFGDAVKGLFQSSSEIEKQYIEGMMGRTGGMDVFESTYLATHRTGTLAGTPLTNGASLGVSATTNTHADTTDVVIDGLTNGTTLVEGDVITIANIYDVHPETKQSTGKLKQFVVRSGGTAASNTLTATVSPALIYGAGNAFQNCVISGASDTDNNAVSVVGTINTNWGENLAFHRNAFAFATADLEDVSRDGAWGARETYDGISMRVARQYDIVNDRRNTRIDVLYGFTALYPELAVRHRYSL